MRFHVQSLCQGSFCVPAPESGLVDVILGAGRFGQGAARKGFGRAARAGCLKSLRGGFLFAVPRYWMKSSSDSDSSLAALASVIW